MKQRLKNLLKKWFPTIHTLPAKRLARWEKELLAAPPDIKDEETIKHVEIPKMKIALQIYHLFTCFPFLGDRQTAFFND
ncbi:hypothetical protein [Photorhabdus viridis]|uniref:hypothetical protein n=1 Tax=Photorhabdus viridis TaxID=3163327 RepID=UPI003306AB19